MIEGIASVDESAITGESAPVIRESGGDRSAVTGGTRVLSDEIVVLVTAKPGESFLDRMIALVEGAVRRKTPNEIALDILLAGLTIMFLVAVVTLQPFAIYSDARQSTIVLVALLVCLIPTTIGALLSAIGIAGMDRLVQRNVLALSGRAVEAAGDCDVLLLDKTGTITLGNRQATDLIPAPGRHPRAARGRRAALEPRRRDARGPLDRRAREGAVRAARARPPRRDVRPVLREHPHERDRHRRPLGAQGRRRRRPPLGHRDGRHAFPRELEASVDRIAASGGTPLVVAENGRALGVVHLKDVVKQGMRERFDEMRRMGIRTVMITGDNPLTAKAIADEAGVDDFLAEATPEDKMALIKREQAAGRLVAMTGDGTNDAPALAQADVGVAMNTGTQAAKEAGNMVDLDSNPTKLIEIVEIGKQLLITRGSLTTFSIANDVAKYFAIIPAMFAGAFPVLDRLNVMDLVQRADRDPLGRHLQRAHHRRADPAGAPRRALPRRRRGGAAAPQPAVYGARRDRRAVRRHQARRPRSHRTRSLLMRRQLVPAILAFVVFTVLVGVLYPLAVTGVAQLTMGDRADGSLVRRDGVVVGSSLLGQPFEGERVVPPAPLGRRRRLRRRGQLGVEPRPDEPRAPHDRRGAVAAYRELNGVAAGTRRCRWTP